MCKKSNYEFIEGGVCASQGFLASGMYAGFKRNKSKLDLALIYSETMCNCAGVYTLNKVQGAPIVVTKKHLEDNNNKAQAVIINSGNANTCNLDGEEKAFKMCELAGEALNIKTQDVLVASTGIIGQVLPIEPVENNISALKEKLSTSGNTDASKAILTTDLVTKECAVEFKIGDKTCRVGGMSKGSGMIHPNMATMLAFVTTDVNISKEILQETLTDVTNDTFNMISVDGDTSTNDTVILMANSKADNKEISDKNSDDYKMFYKALYLVLEDLSKAIAQDGEGATKLLECNVLNACDKNIAKVVAKSVITSSLFKSAMFGKDPNWGRILCAIGYAEAEFNINKIQVEIKSEVGSIIVCQEGRGVDFDIEFAVKILEAHDVFINIDMNDGEASAKAWGCDLTYDYVKINADYHT